MSEHQNDFYSSPSPVTEGPTGSSRTQPDGFQQWTLDNIYTIARREIRRLGPDDQGQRSEPTVGRSREMWSHVLRLCEKAGCQSRGVLRDNGGSVGEG